MEHSDRICIPSCDKIKFYGAAVMFSAEFCLFLLNVSIILTVCGPLFSSPSKKKNKQKTV